MLLLNYKLSAAEALHFGFVSKLYKKSELDTILWEEIKEYSKLPRESLCVTKKLVSQFERENLEKVCDRELEELYKRFESDEFMEAIAKFMQRKSKL